MCAYVRTAAFAAVQGRDERVILPACLPLPARLTSVCTWAPSSPLSVLPCLVVCGHVQRHRAVVEGKGSRQIIMHADSSRAKRKEQRLSMLIRMAWQKRTCTHLLQAKFLALPAECVRVFVFLNFEPNLQRSAARKPTLVRDHDDT